MIQFLRHLQTHLKVLSTLRIIFAKFGLNLKNVTPDDIGMNFESEYECPDTPSPPSERFQDDSSNDNNLRHYFLRLKRTQYI